MYTSKPGNTDQAIPSSTAPSGRAGQVRRTLRADRKPSAPDTTSYAFPTALTVRGNVGSPRRNAIAEETAMTPGPPIVRCVPTERRRGGRRAGQPRGRAEGQFTPLTRVS